MTIAERLADHILAVDADALPADAVHWAKIGILDTVAVTLAGATEPCTQLALGLPGVADADGPALIFGTRRRTSALDAVLVNGIASHALDYDDVNNQIGGHPSVPLVPALFAAAEMRGGVTGREAVAAYVAGFEAETRIGMGVHYHHYQKGWHPTATLGVFGTVAVAARLLGLDHGQTATALGMATSLASGLKANFGTMTKPLHIGHSLRCGMMATLLARDGFTANAGAFEHKQGFLEVFNGAGTYDVERLFANWGDPWNVADPGPSLKAYPCCGSTHGPIDCALEIVRQGSLDPDAIDSVTIRTDPKRLPHTDNPDPTSGLGAKFSVQYVVARALIDGAVQLGHFDATSIADPVVRRLMAKVSASAHPDMSNPATDTYAAEMVVTLTDGTELTARSGAAVLRGPARPMDEAELFGKFADCTRAHLSPDAGRAVFGMLLNLDGLDDVAMLTETLARDAGDTAAAAE